MSTSGKPPCSLPNLRIENHKISYKILPWAMTYSSRSDWKKANNYNTNIYKQESRTEAGNYRPVPVIDDRSVAALLTKTIRRDCYTGTTIDNIWLPYRWLHKRPDPGPLNQTVFTTVQHGFEQGLTGRSRLSNLLDVLERTQGCGVDVI